MNYVSNCAQASPVFPTKPEVGDGPNPPSESDTKWTLQRNGALPLAETLAERNHHTIDCNLERVGLLDVLLRLRNRDVQYHMAERLYRLALVNPGAHVVAHSFGCLMTVRAMELGA